MPILALQSPTFQPAMRIIAAITLGNPTIITTTFDHNYISGEIVRLNIPFGFGAQQLNQMTGTIIVTSPTTFTIDIDSLFFDAFAIPPENPGHFYTQAQIVPIGEVNATVRAATKNVLPNQIR